MTTESKAKKNTDYSASAVNLLNPQEVEISLCELHSLQKLIEANQAGMDALVPEELKFARKVLEEQLASVTQRIREQVNSLGSYQNIEQGWYAVKQRKLSQSFKAEPFEKVYPQYAPAVIVKAVDTAKLTGLIKGGLLDEARLEADGVLTITESYAYVIR